MSLTSPISEHHKDVQLYTNFFFVNGYPILSNKSEKIKFVTARPCKSRSTAKIKNLLDMVIDKYYSRVFNVTDSVMDSYEEQEL